MGKIRRIITTALAGAALASGMGLIVAPDAAAQPKSCTLLWNSQNGAQDEWLWYREQYGDSDKKTIAARAVYVSAINRTVRAGC